ncbi:PriCT-2 domain-containing protein [Thiohalocapsa marina]|uniref:PriCT-2 domain-containing protein n=1 Tax=Thiohalocapsa marina TaxID=424902 RepID=UPI0036DDB5FC
MTTTPSKHVPAIALDPEQIRAEVPAAMQQAPRWLLWRYEPADRAGAKPRKVPYYASGQRRAGKLDTATDRKRLVTLAYALKTITRATAPYGLGFALGIDDDGNHWQGIDLDDTANRPELAALVDQLPGYVERSPSGTGVHAIGCGQPFQPLGSNDTGVEAYAGARYFTVTGDAIGGDIEDLSTYVRDTLTPLHRQRRTATPATPQSDVTAADPDTEILTTDQRRDLTDALGHLDPDPYHTWIAVGQRLHGLGSIGRDLWLAWSARSDKFDASEAAAKWATFSGERTGWRAILSEAQSAGWRNPASRGARQGPPPADPDAQGDPEPMPPAERTAGPYVWADGVFYLLKQISTGRGQDRETVERRIPLANFSAIVAEERMYDDGVDAEPRTLLRAFRPLAERMEEREVEIPTERFAGMTWVPTKLGHGYVVAAGSSVRDHLRAAMQTFSADMATRRIYTHTGWRMIDNALAYLHAGGAITADGLRADVDVELDDVLGHYHLPPPPDPEQVQVAVRASLRQLDLIDATAGAVQLCRVFGAPLGHWFRLDLGIFVHGRTGTFKSELGGLAMAHYGERFGARTLPENWETTEAAMLMKAFAIKDALFEVDDYNPQGAAADHLALGKKADRLFRGAANRAGRGRLTSDIRLRRSYYPRGLVSASGEDLPPGRSLRARLWVLELEPGAMDLEQLTRCQRDAAAGTYASAFSAYIQWLARQSDTLAETLPARYETLRTEAGRHLADHQRIPANLAAMLLILETVFRFTVEVGALDRDAAAEHYRRCADALREQAVLHAGLQEQSEDAVRALDLLRAVFGTGRAHVIDASTVPAARPPATDAHLLGWRNRQRIHAADADAHEQWEPQGEQVGYWIAPDPATGRHAPELWLSPDATYGALARIARDQGAGALRTQHRLAKALVERGYLIRGDGRNIGHRHGRRNLSPARVWRIPLEILHGTDADPTADPAGSADVPAAA